MHINARCSHEGPLRLTRATYPDKLVGTIFSIDCSFRRRFDALMMCMC